MYFQNTAVFKQQGDRDVWKKRHELCKEDKTASKCFSDFLFSVFCWLCAQVAVTLNCLSLASCQLETWMAQGVFEWQVVTHRAVKVFDNYKCWCWSMKLMLYCLEDDGQWKKQATLIHLTSEIFLAPPHMWLALCSSVSPQVYPILQCFLWSNTGWGRYTCLPRQQECVIF